MRARFWGLLLAILGIFLVLITVPRFTGFAVFEDSSLQNNIQIIGVIFFIGGILIFMAQRKSLESHVDVYDDGAGKTDKDREKRHYFMTDSELGVSSDGKVSLGDFTRQINSYRGQKDGEEYIQVIREAYSQGLHEIVVRGGENAKVARAFLDVLEGPEENEEEKDLSREENREITEAFRTYDGTLNKRQKEILGRYGISWEHGGKHNHLVKGGHRYTLATTPSDWRTAMNSAKGIVRFIRDNLD